MTYHVNIDCKSWSEEDHGSLMTGCKATKGKINFPSPATFVDLSQDSKSVSSVQILLY